MDNQDKLTKNMEHLRGIIKTEMEKSWKEGYAAGVISACGVLYKTFQIAGLEGNNMLFTILKNLAEKNGCKDLEQYSKTLGEQK
jgi:hypothetical protein